MVKLLVLGDVQGKFESAFKAVEVANKKAGPFDAVLCCGQFFGEGSAIDQLEPWFMEEKKIPVPTYFVAADEPNAALIDGLPEGGEILDNLHYLGRAGVREIAGLQVAFLSGRYSRAVYKTRPSARKSRFDVSYLELEVEQLLAAAPENGIDVLLTSEWGEGALKLQEEPPRLAFSSPVVATIATRVAPRYHFAGLENMHMQLPPYKAGSRAPFATRFYGLGMVGNPDKVKYIQAFSMKPVAEGPVEDEPATSNPYLHVPKPKEEPKDTTPRIQHETLPNGNWKCAMCGNVNYARQKDQCHMRKCGAPREGNLELFQMSKVGLKGRGVAGLPGAGGGGGGEAGGGRRVGVMTAEDVAVAQAKTAAEERAAAEEKAAIEAERNAPKRMSLYQGQKPQTKFRKK